MVAFGVLLSSISEAQVVPNILIKNLAFEMKCDFGQENLPCVSASVSLGNAPSSLCTYSGSSGTSTKFICRAPNGTGQAKATCSKFLYSGDSRCSAPVQNTQWVNVLTPARLANQEGDWVQTETVANITSGGVPYSVLSQSSDKLNIEPYFANQIALALIKSNPDRYRMTVLNWIKWYLAHVNVTSDTSGGLGTVYRYSINPQSGSQTSLNSYDSADSYAATFMILLDAYASIYPVELAALLNTSSNSYRLSLILGSVYELMDRGLTAAKKDYLIYYTLDNSEVYAGLTALCRLKGRINMAADVGWACAFAPSVAYSMNINLFSSAANLFAPYLGQAPSMNSIYPDMLAQVWPVLYGVSTDAQTNAGLAQAIRTSPIFSSWLNLSADPFPHVSIARGLKGISGSTIDTEVYIHSVVEKFISQGQRHWPWHVGEASELIQLLNSY